MKLKIIVLHMFSFLLISCGGGGNSTQSPASQSIAVFSASGSNKSLSVKSDLSVSSDCYVSAGDFTVLTGSISTSSDSCGKFIGYTDGSLGAYSTGRYEYAYDVSDQVSIEVSQKKISGNFSRPIEVYFLGGAFGWAFDGTQAYYYLDESESHWTGWIASSQFDAGSQNKVAIHQSGKTIVVYVNGNELDQFELQSNVTAKRVSIFFKGDPGIREVMDFDQFLVLDRKAETTTLTENAALSLGQFESTELRTVTKSGTVNLGDLGGNSVSTPVRRLVIKNTSNIDIESPAVVTETNSGAVALSVPSSNACSSRVTLKAGASCSVFIRPVSESEHTSLTSAPFEVPLGISTGSSIKPINALVQAAPVVKTPKITSLNPTIAQIGVRTLFTVLGSNLPSTLALKFDGSTCENSAASKPAVNQIYCTPTASSTGRVFVMSDNTASAKQLAAKVVKLSNPNLYSLPLDAAYVTSANVSLEFGKYNSDVKKYHTGIDIMTKDLNPSVYSIADGIVVWNSTSSSKYTTDYLKYFNAFVIVKHGDFYAYYGHLTSSVKVGDTLSAGGLIGTIRDGYKSDSTKNTKLNHLHLSISKGTDWQSSGWGYQATKEKAIAIFVDPKKYAGL